MDYSVHTLWKDGRGLYERRIAEELGILLWYVQVLLSKDRKIKYISGLRDNDHWPAAGPMVRRLWYGYGVAAQPAERRGCAGLIII